MSEQITLTPQEAAVLPVMLGYWFSDETVGAIAQALASRIEAAGD